MKTESLKKVEEDKEDIKRKRNRGNDREENRTDTKEEVMLDMLKFMKEERLNRSPKRD